MSQPPLLPPIQGHDSAPHMQQYHQPQSHHYAPPPPPPAMKSAPIHHHPHPPSNTYVYPDTAPAHSQQSQQQQHQLPVLPPNGTPNGLSQIRYALPPQQMDSRQMSGGRQKKEIKRRTKTGCLTCRKRRIKCDEAHPACRNCQKSKRECLGYDPIFKAQGVPAPILPASEAVQQPQQQPSPLAALQQPAYSAPHGYAPASSAGYAPPPVHDPPPQEQDYNYGVSLDPALSTGQAPPTEAVPRTYTTTLFTHRLANPLSIEDLFLHEDVPAAVFPPPDDTFQPSEQDLAEMRSMYKEQYARGLDSFFETTWYSTQGEYYLQTNRTTAHFFKYCIERFRITPQPHEEYQTMPSLEARLIWLLATVPRHIPSEQISPLLHDLLPRITTIEHLLSGTYLPPSSVPAVPPDPNPPLQPDSTAALAHSAYTFWHHLATFTSLDDSVSSPSIPDTLSAISHALGSMRHILSMLENRDVLYSVAIARHYGGRAAEYRPDEALVATSQDPEDPISKLVVAFRFLAAEEGAGTTQVVQAFCGMCRRSWSRGRTGGGSSSSILQGSETRHGSGSSLDYQNGSGSSLGYLKSEELDRDMNAVQNDVKEVERADSGRVDGLDGVGLLSHGDGGIKM